MSRTAEQANATKTIRRESLAMRYLPLLITIVAALLCYALFYNRGVWLSVVGYSISPAERVMQGEAPYRDFLYNYTPGILWLNALLMRFFGVSLMTIHVGLFAFKIATLLVLYIVGRKLMGAWAALVPVALALGWIGYKYIFGVFPTQYAMLFVLLAILFMLRYDESDKSRWLMASGASVGLVFLFKYNVGILLFGCGILTLWIREGFITNLKFTEYLLLTVKKSSFYIIGFALIVLPMCAYLYSQQALGAMIDHFLHHASAYSGERAVWLPSLKSLLPVVAGTIVVLSGAGLLLRKAPKVLPVFLLLSFTLAAVALLIPNRAFVIKNSALAAVAYLPFVLFAGVGLLTIWQWRKGTRAAWWRSNGSIIIVTLFALGTYLEIYPRADTYHVVRALPPTFLLIALLLHKGMKIWQEHFRESQSLSVQGQVSHIEKPFTAEAQRTPRPRREWQNRVNAFALGSALSLLLLLLVGVINTWLPNFDSRSRFVDRYPLAIERGRGILVPPKQAEFIENLTQLVDNHSAADDFIFSFGQRGAGFYFLTGRRNPTRFVWWRNVGIKREDREAVLQMVNDRRAKLILLQDSLKDRRIREIVNANYHLVGNASGIGVFDRNP